MTALALSQPLFYAADMGVAQIQLMVVGAYMQPVVDTVDFTAEQGGRQDRHFAIPYLPGMDAVILSEAALAFRVGDMDADISRYTVSNGPSGAGSVLRLTEPGRLRKVEIAYTDPAPTPGQTRHIILRPGDGDGGFGPPIFAAPDFPRPGPTFGRVLSGMAADALGGGRWRLSLPDLMGSAWLIQIADGNDATALNPLAIKPVVNRVTLAAAPRNLSVTLEGSEPTPLWGNPGLLLPDSGSQDVAFLPIAQRRLTEALAAATPDAPTLPLSLSFKSDSAGRLEVTRRALTARYEVRPFGDAPQTVRLGGRPARLALPAPAGLKPMTGTVTLTAKLLGRALNPGSPDAPVDSPGQGLRVSAERHVAARIIVAARPGSAVTAPVPVASIAAYVEAPEQAEMVIELRADAAGRPGAPIAPPLVRQLVAGDRGWIDLDLPTPIMVPPGSTLWAAARLTKGIVFWHAAPAAGDATSALSGGAMVSVDKGASWGDATIALGGAVPLLVQAYHAEDPPFPRPVIRLRVGGTLLGPDWFAGAVAESPNQYRLSASFPAALLDRLRLAPASGGDPRATTDILFHCSTMLDLVLTDARLEYDPATARTA